MRTTLAGLLLIIGLVSVPVVPAAAATTVDSAESLAAAFDSATNASTTIVLADDIVADDSTELRMPSRAWLVLDLAGHALVINSVGRPGIRVPASTYLTIDDSVGGGQLRVTSAGDDVAAIGNDGSADGGIDAGRLTIAGGTVTAIGDTGIGTGASISSSGGEVAITGGTVIANGQRGAGIGGRQSHSGQVTIDGGIVTATSERGPGIGTCMREGDRFIVEVRSGSATATGGGSCAGIGGWLVMIAVTVNATATSTGAGIDSSELLVGASAHVTAESESGYAAIAPDRLDIHGHLIIPRGSTFLVQQSAGVSPNYGVITGGGTITGDGTIDNRVGRRNSGVITHDMIVEPSLTITGHNYLLTFDASGGTDPIPDDLRIYAATLGDAEAQVPAAVPIRPGFAFTGWYPNPDGSGPMLAADTQLGTGASAELTFYAGWREAVAPTLTGPADVGSVLGEEIVYVPEVTGKPAPSVTSNGLPEGLEIDAATGTITGTPAAGSQGSHQVVLTASNGVDPDATLPVTINIYALELAVSPSQAPVGDQLTIIGSGLPEGASVELQLASDPVVLGTAIAGDDGTFQFTTAVPEGTSPGDHEVIGTTTVLGTMLTDIAPITILPTEQTPAPSPTPTPSEEQTASPAPTPTVEPTPAQEPTDSPDPTPSPSPSPSPSRDSTPPSSVDDEEPGLPSTGGPALALMLTGIAMLTAGGLIIGRRR